MTPEPRDRITPRATPVRKPTRSGPSANQSESNHTKRAVDLVLHDLAQLARTTAGDQRAQAVQAKRRGAMAMAQLHTVSAGVHHHYALQLGQLAENLHAGLVLRGEPSVADLLSYVAPEHVDEFGVDTTATPRPEEQG